MYPSPKVNQCSPVQPDYVRVVNYDEDGEEFITFEPVDYPELQRSLGSVEDWSLNALLKAGVNPNFSIHTGNPTRLEGINAVEAFAREADSILSENSETPKND